MYRLFRDATHYMEGHHVKVSLNFSQLFFILLFLKCCLIFYIFVYLQDLACLNRDLSKVIFIDWNEKSFKLQPKNALKLKKWTGNDDDKTLYDLANLLRGIELFISYNTFLK